MHAKLRTGNASRHGAWLWCPREQEHHRHPYFARNLSRSFFETPQKRCNSNDANSMFEQAAGELRAKLMGGGGARAGLEIDHSERSSRVAISRAGRRPPAHTAARPSKQPGLTKHTRRPEHPWGRKQQPGKTKTADPERICGFIVREGGVEPPLHHWNTDLNRARLPIPPLARTQKE